MNADARLTLITGAAGFVGRRLTQALKDERPLRCLVRDRDDADLPGDVETVTGDLADREALGALLAGVDCAFYLVHSMEAGTDDDFAERDRRLATNMAQAARAAGVRRLVYLGGIESSEDDSEHLDSRHEVEEILSGFGGEFVALRAAMIVGHGSASFDTLTQIVDRLPVLALPTWRERLCQPVAIDDVIAALSLSAGTDVPAGRYDIAGPDRLTFAAMIEQIAELSGNAPRTFALPFSNSRIEGAAAALVTGQDRALLTPLMAGLDADLVVDDNALPGRFGVTPTPFAQAARSALAAAR